MITIEATTETQSLMDNMGSKLFFKLGIDMVGFSLIAKEAVEQHLASSFPKIYPHLRVTLVGTNQFGINIQILADNIGKLLLEGSPPHQEGPYDGHKMAFEGTKDFAYHNIFIDTVSHPGFEEFKTRVDAVVRKAVLEAAIFARGI